MDCTATLHSVLRRSCLEARTLEPVFRRAQDLDDRIRAHVPFSVHGVPALDISASAKNKLRIPVLGKDIQPHTLPNLMLRLITVILRPVFGRRTSRNESDLIAASWLFHEHPGQKAARLHGQLSHSGGPSAKSRPHREKGLLICTVFFLGL